MNKILPFILLALLGMFQTVQATELPAKYTNEFGMNFVLIPPGMHQMRSYRYHYPDYSEAVIVSPWHWVRFNKPFYLQSTEVTQKQLEQVIPGLSQEVLATSFASFYNQYSVPEVSNFQEFKPINSGPDYPVHYIDPEYIDTFLERLNTGPLVYRLPTEAEWEYAALAGATRPPAGEDLKYYANCRINDADRFNRLTPVGSLLPNAWGLYDMLGNVNEIVMPYKPAANHPKNTEQYLLDDPVPNNEKPKYTGYYNHRIKGGDFWDSPKYCNPFIVDDFDKKSHGEAVGFRLWLDAESVRKALAH